MKNYILALTIFLSSCSFEQVNDDEIVIYTSRQPQLIENLLNVFTEETGIQVTILSGDAQQLMERIAVEGSGTDADIFMTVDAGVLWQAADKGIFEPIIASGFPSLSNLPFLAPKKYITTKAPQPPTECTRVDPAKS